MSFWLYNTIYLYLDLWTISNNYDVHLSNTPGYFIGVEHVLFFCHGLGLCNTNLRKTLVWTDPFPVRIVLTQWEVKQFCMSWEIWSWSWREKIMQVIENSIINVVKLGYSWYLQLQLYWVRHIFNVSKQIPPTHF